MDNNRQVNPVDMISDDGIQRTQRGILKSLGAGIWGMFLFFLKIQLNFLLVYLLLYLPHIVPFKALGWEPLYYTLNMEYLQSNWSNGFQLAFSEGFLLLTFILSLFPFRMIAQIVSSPSFLFTYIVLIVASLTLSPFVEITSEHYILLGIGAVYCLLIVLLRNKITFLKHSLNFDEDKSKGFVSTLLGTNNLFTPEEINKKRGRR